VRRKGSDAFPLRGLPDEARNALEMDRSLRESCSRHRALYHDPRSLSASTTVKNLSRRMFLVSVSAATGVALVASGVLRGWRRGVAGWLLADPSAGPRPMSEHELNTLDAVVGALLTAQVDRARYREFLRWHAEGLPGRGQLYGALVARLDDVAVRMAGLPFAACDTATQRTILEPARRLRVSGARGWGDAMFRRHWLLFNEHLASPVLILFSCTDAWVLAGYAGWPGQAGQLDFDHKGPPAASGSSVT
jgi:hypothetical protein